MDNRLRITLSSLANLTRKLMQQKVFKTCCEQNTVLLHRQLFKLPSKCSFKVDKNSPNNDLIQVLQLK